jgi:chromosome segregation ATPase
MHNILAFRCGWRMFLLNILSLQKCSHIERFVSVKKPLQKDINPYQERITQLESELQIQRQQVKILSSQIENPIQSDHWRQLGGEDPDDEQMDAKINVLEQRLSDSREQLTEREVMYEEMKAQASELEEKIQTTAEATQPIMKHLNESQNRHRDVTRSMMALVSELSMYQKILMQLEEEKEHQEELLHQSQQLVKDGKPPSDEALRDLKRLLKERKIDFNDMCTYKPENYTDSFGHVYYPATYAIRTTAEPRPKAYIPESGIEIPKPYGAMAPFKSLHGTAMTQLR